MYIQPYIDWFHEQYKILTKLNWRLDGYYPPCYVGIGLGDVLQGAAADCNSAEVTHAWFDSRVAHQFHPILSN